MQQKVLIYVNSRDGLAVVVEVSGSEVESIREDVGSNLEDWPNDLGAYGKGDGLYIWEGEVGGTYDDPEMPGKVRELKPEEWDRVRRNIRVLE
jgi:hypothetical protein